MRKYSKEESKELVNIINKIQRATFKYKRENGREPSIDEIAKIANESLEKIIEVKEVLKELEKQDEEINQEYKIIKKHTKEDIENARKIRKSKS